MAEQYKEMSPADVREQKMRDNMGKAADKAKENSLGTKTDKSMMQKALEWIDPTLKNGPINQNNRDVQDAKKITVPAQQQQQKREVRYAPSPENAKFNDDYKKGGFVDHNTHVKKHAAGFKHHDDHVKAMCGGGMAKGKK